MDRLLIATEHYTMVRSLMETGRVVENHTYSSIAAMHSWLASFGLTSGLPDTTTIKTGLPLTGVLMPLLGILVDPPQQDPP